MRLSCPCVLFQAAAASEPGTKTSLICDGVDLGSLGHKEWGCQVFLLNMFSLYVLTE